jgi:NADH dehydrogenase (ubiquinone) Fe-S protein 1
MRSQLLRAAARSKPSTNLAGRRTFSSTRKSAAEVELTVDGKKVSIEAGSALIQACEKAGVTVPRYCYHEYVFVSLI